MKKKNAHRVLFRQFCILTFALKKISQKSFKSLFLKSERNNVIVSKMRELRQKNLRVGTKRPLPSAANCLGLIIQPPPPLRRKLFRVYNVTAPPLRHSLFRVNNATLPFATACLGLIM